MRLICLTLGLILSAAPPARSKPAAKAGGTDARTVAELYAQKTSLKGKKAVVRGKVVKVTNDVMDLNWVHLRDGSGDAKTRDNDLTFTSTQTFKIGQLVTIAGTITLDKDLGGRYKFPILLEGALISR
jgi:starvation-inducible outer membrane lipoprotein